MSAQFVPRPDASALVCDCKRQPVLADGQLNRNCEPVLVKFKTGDTVETTATFVRRICLAAFVASVARQP